MRKQAEEEALFIGMEMPPPLSKKHDPVVKADKAAEQRRVTQDQYEQQYQSALVNIKKKLHEVEGPDIKENMSDQIREWFIACREQTGKFPDYPSADDGGSKKIFEAPPADGEAASAPASAKSGKKGGKKGGKKSAGGKKEKKSAKGDKKKGKGKKGDGWFWAGGRLSL